MSHDRTVIRHAVEEIGFGFFTDDEIKELSVKRITSPVTFDTMNNPLPGGLYDPALGPVDRSMMCETCGQDQKNCPGHLGHIELAVSVYHPLLFGALYKLMRAKCFNCHNLRLAKSKTRLAAVKMMLVDAGRRQEALELDDTLLGYLRQDGFKEGEGDDAADTQGILSANGYRERVLGSLEHELDGCPRAQWCGGHDRAIRRQLVEGLIKTMGLPKKCENCGAVSPGIRKDGSNKLFQVPLSEKSRQINRSCNTDIMSAVQGRDPGTGGTAATVAAADDSDPMSEEESEGEGDDMDNHGTTVVGQDASDATATAARADKFMPPIEVELQMQLLWKREASTLNLMFGSGSAFTSTAGADGKSSGSRATVGRMPVKGVDAATVAAECHPERVVRAKKENGFRLFFVRAIAVPPPRFRPPMNMGDFVAEHPQNVYLTKALSLNEKLKNAESLKGDDLASALTTWIELQTTVNCYMDSSKDPRGLKDTPPGLRQVLEKKEGLFRKHMMGKRVNYACRSVISPDPYLGTTEIGIPLRFAKELTYPQPVADWNVQAMRELVEAGAQSYPGANFVEDASGRLLYLDRLSELKRRGVAARLLSTPGQKVWRHLKDGDCMLVNRQPTLHKPGIMAHRVRVLRNPSYQTIRMHYANCNTYNADFDGDEINCHLPQNEVARAEANLLAFTDEQYLVPTNGKPLRGLIQDHVDAGVKMCSKDTFFTRGEYQQLVYQALSGLPGLEVVPPSGHIHTLSPAILKPIPRWTGKQVMSTILKHLTAGLPQLNLDGKTKTPAVAFGEAEQEHKVVFREGELLQGVLDKAAFGSTEYGLVHAVHEVYGSTAAGKLLTALGRVLTIFLQSSGHTCGIEDLTLNRKAEGVRRGIIEKSLGVGQRSMRDLLNRQDGGGEGEAGGAPAVGVDSGTDKDESPLAEEDVEAIRQRTATFLLGEERDTRLADIDRRMQSALAPVSSNIIKACLPDGQSKPFPGNCFSLMVLTGGKGSMVNHSQVSCALGQQALEGRRVPVMVSGKSLPSFQAFEPSPRANGFITDRFLTGIRPQEYYFHCMAGREGLVDTAVKTSRSGYLQRCLVKHLEELKVGYDNTVRDGEGCVHQFLYGEDGVDTTQTKYLSSKQLGFLAQNYHALRHKHGITPTFVNDAGFDPSRAVAAHAAIVEATSKSVGNGTSVAVSGTEDQRGNGAGPVFAVGESILARRRAHGGDGGWGDVSLEKGWYKAEVVKVKHGGTPNATYTCRYGDGMVAKRVPPIAQAASSSSESDDGSDENEGAPHGATGRNNIAGRKCRIRARCLLKKDNTFGNGLGVPDPVLSTFSVNNLGCVSESFQSSLTAFLESEPATLKARGSGGACAAGGGGGGDVAIADPANGGVDAPLTSCSTPSLSSTKKNKKRNRLSAGGGGSTSKENGVAPFDLKEAFQLLMWVKYQRSLAAPGEAVGSIAAQSVGEPSTQMTLNTFHLAGHGGANVTLGIPRLREIIMTAAKNLKTPSTVVPLRDGASREEADRLALRLSRLSLSQLVHNKGGVTVRERIVKGDTGLWERHYAIALKTFPSKLIRQAFGIEFKKICQSICSTFIPNLFSVIQADLKRTGEKVNAKGGISVGHFRGKGVGSTSAVAGDEEGVDDRVNEQQAAFARRAANVKKAAKADAEYESDDEDEEGQGTLTFGKQKEQASYGGMDEEEKAIYKAMSGKQSEGLLSDGDEEDGYDDDQHSRPSRSSVLDTVEDDDDQEDGRRRGVAGKDDGYLNLPAQVTGSSLFKGVTKNRKTGQVEITVKLASSVRRLLMVGLAEAAAAKTMVRFHKGINGAFVVETTGGGKSGVAVQLEGSCFETVWGLKEGGAGGILDLNKLTSNDVWAVCQTYGVEAARASIVSEITGVFGAYGIQVDPRHLGLVADHMTFNGGYRPMNRMGMSDFSSPCLQMSFETTAEFMAKAAVSGTSDRLKSPSARIVVGRVGAFGTGMFDLRQPA